MPLRALCCCTAPLQVMLVSDGFMKSDCWRSDTLPRLACRPSRPSLLGLGLTLLIGLVACHQHAGHPPENPNIAVLRRGLGGGTPASLDPAGATDTFSTQVLQDLYEGLTSESPTGDVLPGVASSWVVDETGTQYTFQLRSMLAGPTAKTFAPKNCYRLAAGSRPQTRVSCFRRPTTHCRSRRDYRRSHVTYNAWCLRSERQCTCCKTGAACTIPSATAHAPRNLSYLFGRKRAHSRSWSVDLQRPVCTFSLAARDKIRPVAK